VPQAAFGSVPPSSHPGILVAFNDLSTVASGNITSWYWSFGDGGTSTAQNPSHTYPDPGSYNVCLVVFAGSCADSICTVYLVEPEEILVPNVITPNGDGQNDALVFTNLEFFPGSKLKIYNRWGEVVYESDDYRNDWRGGVSDGTYYFVLSVATLNQQKTGFLEVLNGTR
jgi:gliding motility-associated-like protein